MRTCVHIVAALLLSTASTSVAAEKPKPAGDLAVACSVPNVEIVPVRSGIDLALEKARKTWVQSREGLGFLSPDCKVELILKVSPAGTFDSVTPAGDVLYQRFHNQGAAKAEPEGIFFLAAGATEALALTPPKDLKEPALWKPVLSDDGKAVVWLEAQEKSPGEIEPRLGVRDLVTGRDRFVPLVNARGQLELMAANVSTGEYVLGRLPNEVMIFDQSGELTAQPIRPSAIKHVTWSNFQRLNDGWVAWDVGREGGDELQWSTSRGSGTKQIASLRFESVAVDPSSKWIAFSAGRGGAVKANEGVSIILLEDGSEVFHRPPATRATKLAFLGSDYLAMSTEKGVNVLRMRAPSKVIAEAADPEPAGDDNDDNPQVATSSIDMASMRNHAAALAKRFGMTLETPDSEAILGRWRMCVMQDSQCEEGMFFRMFRENGYAYDEEGVAAEKYSITEDLIVLDPVSESGRERFVFQMSGAFYLPSHEMGLWKLERMD